MIITNNKLSKIESSIQAGFPNMNFGFRYRTLDLTKIFVKHPASSYLLRIDNDKWNVYNLYEGDYAVIDRSMVTKPLDLVLWSRGDKFEISRGNEMPHNKVMWGTISCVIHQLTK